MPLILLAILTSMIDNVFVENFTIKKENNYQGSYRNSLIFRVGVFIITINNAITYHFGTLTLFNVGSALAGGFTLLWFILGGYQLYLHRTPRMILLFGCGFMITNGVILLLLIKPRIEGTNFSILEWTITLGIVMFFLTIF